MKTLIGFLIFSLFANSNLCEFQFKRLPVEGQLDDYEARLGQVLEELHQQSGQTQNLEEKFELLQEQYYLLDNFFNAKTKAFEKSLYTKKTPYSEKRTAMAAERERLAQSLEPWTNKVAREADQLFHQSSILVEKPLFLKGRVMRPNRAAPENLRLAREQDKQKAIKEFEELMEVRSQMAPLLEEQLKYKNGQLGQGLNPIELSREMIRLEKQLIERQQKVIDGMKEILGSRGISYRELKKETRVWISFTLDAESYDNAALNALRKIQERHAVNEITVDPLKNLKEGTGGFYNRLEQRLEMNLEGAYDIFARHKLDSVTTHEARHALFEMRRRQGLQSVYNSSYYDPLQMNSLGRGSFYTNYMSVEEIYNHAKDLNSIAKRLDGASGEELASLLKRLREKVRGNLQINNNSHILAYDFSKEIKTLLNSPPAGWQGRVVFGKSRDAPSVTFVRADGIELTLALPGEKRLLAFPDEKAPLSLEQRQKAALEELLENQEKIKELTDRQTAYFNQLNDLLSTYSHNSGSYSKLRRYIRQTNRILEPVNVPSSL